MAQHSREPTVERGDHITEIQTFLGAHPPFDILDPHRLAAVAAGARARSYRRGELVLDAFDRANDAMYVVRAGQVQVWNDDDPAAGVTDEILGPGGVFGYSAMLTGRSIGPRVVAAVDGTVILRLPGALLAPAFATERGAQFLAAAAAAATVRHPASYTLVDDLIRTEPLVVRPELSVSELATAMTEREWPMAAVELPSGGYGLVTDALLRSRVLAATEAPASRADSVMDPDPPSVRLGSSAAEALILLLETRAPGVLVTDRDERLRGIVVPRDFMVSPTTAGVSLHEQLRRVDSIAELQRLARMAPSLLTDLLGRRLNSGRVVAVYSAIVDAVVRQAITLVFAAPPAASAERFTWLALGSHGRHEAVLSSDIDAAVAFADDVSEEEMTVCRQKFSDIAAVLAGAGLAVDEHGAFPSRPLFSRTNKQWRAAGQSWLSDPVPSNGAMMASLLVDGRPIHGDPGLPEVSRVFGELRSHPGTMRLLLAESLARRARLRSVRSLLGRREDRLDLKTHAVLPIVNLARWVALSQGSAELPTVERLRAGAGSSILPQAQADTLVEVFDVLQRLRLRYQLREQADGHRVGNVVAMDRLSAIDRSVITRAVREIAAVQKRMDNVAEYVPAAQWTAPESAP